MSLFKKEYDEVTGYTKSWYWDDQEKKLTCKSSMDVSSVVDMCRRLEAETHKKSRIFAGEHAHGHRIASIPNIVVHEIMQKHSINPYSADQEEMKRFQKIVQQEYPYLMTTRARL